jgi:hypothetical protein
MSPHLTAQIALTVAMLLTNTPVGAGASDQHHGAHALGAHVSGGLLAISRTMVDQVSHASWGRGWPGRREVWLALKE